MSHFQINHVMHMRLLVEIGFQRVLFILENLKVSADIWASHQKWAQNELLLKWQNALFVQWWGMQDKERVWFQKIRLLTQPVPPHNTDFKFDLQGPVYSLKQWLLKRGAIYPIESFSLSRSISEGQGFTYISHYFFNPKICIKASYYEKTHCFLLHKETDSH